MPFAQIATKKEDHILFKGDGSLKEPEEFIQWCMMSISMAQESGQSRLLYDNRTLQLDLTQHDITTVSEQLADDGIQLLGLRFAVVSSVKTLAVAKLIETAFANRSAAYKIFDTQKKALEWLLA